MLIFTDKLTRMKGKIELQGMKFHAYELVKTEMEVPSQLLEHVAGRISAALKTHFPELSGLRLKISKKSPPLGGEVESASVILEDE